jgi:hypothetical protein
MPEPPRIGDALPADDPVSLWLTSLAWAFGDMQIATVALSDGHESLGDGLSTPASIYGWRLVTAHFREVARLCGCAKQPRPPAIRRFFNSLPQETREELENVLDSYRLWGNEVRALRNGFFH